VFEKDIPTQMLILKTYQGLRNTDSLII